VHIDILTVLSGDKLLLQRIDVGLHDGTIR
jgi:hypothetical protein